MAGAPDQQERDQYELCPGVRHRLGPCQEHVCDYASVVWAEGPLDAWRLSDYRSVFVWHRRCQRDEKREVRRSTGRWYGTIGTHPVLEHAQSACTIATRKGSAPYVMLFLEGSCWIPGSYTLWKEPDSPGFLRKCRFRLFSCGGAQALPVWTI